MFQVNGLHYAFDKETSFCSIVSGDDDDEDDEGEEFFLFMILQGAPFLFAVIVTVIAYVRASFFFRSLPQHIIESQNLNSKLLLMYPTAQLIIYLPNILYSLLTLFSDESWPRLLLFASNFYNLAGFLNCLIYSIQFSKSKVYKQEPNDGYLSSDSLNITNMTDENCSMEFGRNIKHRPTESMISNNRKL